MRAVVQSHRIRARRRRTYQGYRLEESLERGEKAAERVAEERERETAREKERDWRGRKLSTLTKGVRTNYEWILKECFKETEHFFLASPILN